MLLVTQYVVETSPYRSTISHPQSTSELHVIQQGKPYQVSPHCE